MRCFCSPAAPQDFCNNIGTKRTYRDVRYLADFGGKADICDALVKLATDALHGSHADAQVRRNLAYSGSAFAPESGLLVGEQSPEAAPVTCMKSNLTVQFLPLI